MSNKKVVIDKNGMVKTVVKSESTREARVKEHMHGRNDHIRTNDSETKFVIGMIVGLGCIVALAWLIWLMMK